MADTRVLPVGSRVRVNDGSPWPERIGCLGTVVAPPENGMYPQPAKWEVLILLDDDPLDPARNYQHEPYLWSCVIASQDVDMATNTSEESRHE